MPCMTSYLQDILEVVQCVLAVKVPAGMNVPCYSCFSNAEQTTARNNGYQVTGHTTHCEIAKANTVYGQCTCFSRSYQEPPEAAV